MTDKRFDAKAFIARASESPGVYQMLDEQGDVLYIGKARNLRKRLASYFGQRALGARAMAMVARVARVEVSVTRNEKEALILEHNLIKSHRPPYNVMLRDDKSYQHILLSKHEFPRLAKRRNVRRNQGRSFGPFPSGGKVRATIDELHKAFQLRSCEDSVFKQSTRPCLQHQIGRCSAPCVGAISRESYAESVANAESFLSGKGDELLVSLRAKMHELAESRRFEQAAETRDQIARLEGLLEEQVVVGAAGDVDVIAIAMDDQLACAQVLFSRGGRVQRSCSYFPRIGIETTPEQALSALVAQLYLGERLTDIPAVIALDRQIKDRALLEQALCERASSAVSLRAGGRGDRAKLLQLARLGAEANLFSRGSRHGVQAHLAALGEVLKLEGPLRRIECFDVSHLRGEAAVASCVVFDESGPKKDEYRAFNITGVVGGDDLAALAQAVKRRYKRVLAEGGVLPDLLLIDGGRGQLKAALGALDELGINLAKTLGVAKGEGRKSGLETLFVDDGRKIKLASDSPVLHLILRVRDESHRFAVRAHRRRRAASRQRSVLEDIPGVGACRRLILLRRFGSLAGVKRAKLSELEQTPGIPASIAQKLYDMLRSS